MDLHSDVLGSDLVEWYSISTKAIAAIEITTDATAVCTIKKFDNFALKLTPTLEKHQTLTTNDLRLYTCFLLN